jgi:hypothetical protein
MKIPRRDYSWFAAPRAFTLAGASVERPPAVPTTWIRCPLQVPRAIALIRPLVQEKLAARIGHVEQELPLLGFQNALLHAAQLDLQYFL